MSTDPNVTRKPSVYANDLSVDVTLGFACFHIVFGLIAATFGSIFLLGFADMQEWRASTEGIGCGIIFVFTGCIGLWAANERKNNFSKANDSIRIFLLASILSILTSVSFIILTAAGVTVSSRGSHLIVNLTLTLLFETLNSLLSGLTAAKIIWPMRFNFYARKWPTHCKVTKKVIVSTSILARGLYNSQDFQRSLGPNCVVSLAPPAPPPPPPRSPHHRRSNSPTTSPDSDRSVTPVENQDCGSITRSESANESVPSSPPIIERLDERVEGSDPESDLNPPCSSSR